MGTQTIDTLVDEVLASVHDGSMTEEQIDTILSAINFRRDNARRETLGQCRQGSRVRFNDRTNPAYLRGCEGTVRKKNVKTVVVDLDEPVYGPQGKRWHTNIRVPGTLIDVVV